MTSDEDRNSRSEIANEQHRSDDPSPHLTASDYFPLRKSFGYELERFLSYKAVSSCYSISMYPRGV